MRARGGRPSGRLGDSQQYLRSASTAVAAVQRGTTPAKQRAHLSQLAVRFYFVLLFFLAGREAGQPGGP